MKKTDDVSPGTNSVFRRLVTDVYGRNLLDWRLEDEGPEEKWRWILT